MSIYVYKSDKPSIIQKIMDGEMKIPWKWFCGHKEKSLWWFRIKGWGIHGKDLRKHPSLFSERYGYTKKLVIGNWIFGFLTPRI